MRRGLNARRKRIPLGVADEVVREVHDLSGLWIEPVHVLVRGLTGLAALIAARRARSTEADAHLVQRATFPVDDSEVELLDAGIVEPVGEEREVDARRDEAPAAVLVLGRHRFGDAVSPTSPPGRCSPAPGGRRRPRA